MKLKEITIRWQSCEAATDVTFGCELKFECHFNNPEKAYEKAIAAMRACLIAEGAQYDPAVLKEYQ